MIVTNAKVSLGNWDSTFQAKTEPDASIATSGVRANQLIAMMNVWQNREERRLQKWSIGFQFENHEHKIR
jgi:hypothetical protein